MQDQIYMEINEVIGKRNPTMEDRQSMPLTESLILETLRYHSLVMFAIPHQARCDAELNGFIIPKGTSISMEEKKWKIANDIFGVTK